MSEWVPDNVDVWHLGVARLDFLICVCLSVIIIHRTFMVVSHS